MWLNPSLLPKANFDTQADLVCELTKSDVFGLTEPVTNLYDRAAMIESLREKIEKKSKKVDKKEDKKVDKKVSKKVDKKESKKESKKVSKKKQEETSNTNATLSISTESS